MIRRQHDVQVLAEGTFRVVLTGTGRVVAAIDLPESALGPLHLAFLVGRQPMAFSTGSIFGDIGHAVGHAVGGVGHAVGGAVSGVGHFAEHAAHDVGHFAEHAAHDVGHVAEKAAETTFNAAAKVATTVARPAFNIARDAAASGVHLIAQIPLLPEEERKRIEAASRVMLRARLGDVTAKDFVHAVARAASAGVEEARRAGDALLGGARVVAHVLDAPLALAHQVPVLGGTIKALDPFVKLDRVAGAIQHGDFRTLEHIVTDDVRTAASVASIIPGLGTGVSVALNTGLAVLDGGGPLEIAIHAAYGAIPIPPGLKSITDAVLDSVLSLAHSGSVTDAGLAAARNAVPSGLPRDVFDTLARLVVKRVPIQRAAGDLVSHYVNRYAPGVGQAVDQVGHVVQTVSSPAALAHLAAGAASPILRLPPPAHVS